MSVRHGMLRRCFWKYGSIQGAVYVSWGAISHGPSSLRFEPVASGRQLHAYSTLQRKVTAELQVKRSKFIAVAAPILQEQDAFALLSEVRDPNATHNCWAYKLGEQFRFSDDGEPGGTAGRPIYSALLLSGLDRVMVVVIRYFGGIKLGTGGLARAYGGVTSAVLRDAPTCVVKPKVAMLLEVPYDLIGSIYCMLRSYQVDNLRREYVESGAGICIKLEVELEKTDDFVNSIGSFYHGRVTISKL
eukprot:TRINITY_DN9099_c0_g1_i1.p1 TRINITY_DN9099_c0_g1~~TRINITY_DN9099_c0_g1_i1.p1  ORF type:complete len:245 (-),score=33.94 TRINITY_DN9099_c0_g1_i1:179-913(-)